MKDSSTPRIPRQRYHVLLALSLEDLHGSGIARRVLEQTDGELQLWPATLYGALESLHAEGWIVELEAEDRPPGESGKRRYYRITETGRQVLARETERLANVVRIARRRLRSGRRTAT